ncbi:unnamed protein product [Moneuplotes crassus]|uniref:Uncharacterized protein n=1 Tax=Euplotes crassus TaxID=5936 RepID=A0AAD1Y2Y3_EUPCR|nr:unnamed protein product [Moneuplotes crassus]
MSKSQSKINMCGSKLSKTLDHSKPSSSTITIHDEKPNKNYSKSPILKEFKQEIWNDWIKYGPLEEKQWENVRIEDLKEKITEFKIEMLTSLDGYVETHGRRHQKKSDSDSKQRGSFEFKYFGQVNNAGQRHGIGVCLYRTGRMYQGTWHEDKRSSYGKETLSNNQTYQGEFKNGKFHGEGLYTWTNGDTYNGSWQNGLKHGQGTWKRENGDFYKGNWFQGKIEGFGIYKSKHGDNYEGEWKNFKRHGKGILIDKNQITTIGEFKDGLIEGFGERIWTGTSTSSQECHQFTYKGHFKNGQMNGQGKWRKGMGETANIYEGSFKNGMKHGKGTFTWRKTSDSYTGEFKNDLRDCYGVYTWADGTKYEGQWKNTMHGEGKMIYTSGKIQKQYYIRGRLITGSEKQRITLNQLKDKYLKLNIVKKKIVLAFSGDHLNKAEESPKRTVKAFNPKINKDFEINKKACIYAIPLSSKSVHRPIKRDRTTMAQYSNLVQTRMNRSSEAFTRSFSNNSKVKDLSMKITENTSKLPDEYTRCATAQNDSFGRSFMMNSSQNPQTSIVEMKNLDLGGTSFDKRIQNSQVSISKTNKKLYGSLDPNGRVSIGDSTLSSGIYKNFVGANPFQRAQSENSFSKKKSCSVHNPQKILKSRDLSGQRSRPVQLEKEHCDLKLSQYKLERFIKAYRDRSRGSKFSTVSDPQ